MESVGLLFGLLEGQAGQPGEQGPKTESVKPLPLQQVAV